jgi:hypothetical protein
MGFFAVVASAVRWFTHEFRPRGGFFRWEMVDAAPALSEVFGNIW